MHAGWRSSVRGGFTLVELLVVVAIVMVLAGLLFALLQHSRDSVARASDLGRIRQLALACTSFASEQGHFPDSFQFARKTWDLQLLPSLGQQEVDATPATGLTNHSSAGLEVFAANWDKAPRKPGGLPRGFAMAGWICNAIEGKNGQPGPYTASWGVTWPNHRGAPLIAIRRPAEYILLSPIGKGFQNPANVIGAGAYALSDWPGDDPAAWPYDGSGTFAFCDGSVRILRHSDFDNLTDYRRKYADNSERSSR